MANVSVAKAALLKGRLDQYLKSNNIYEHIRGILQGSDITGEEGTVDPSKVTKLLKEHGIVDQVLDALQTTGSLQDTENVPVASRSVQHGAPQADRVTAQGYQPHVTHPAPSSGSVPGTSVSAASEQRSSGGAQRGQGVAPPPVPQARSYQLPQAATQLRSNTRYLRVHVVKGMAFMEHLLDEDSEYTQGAEMAEEAAAQGGAATAASGTHEDFLQGRASAAPHKAVASSMMYYVLHLFHRGQRFTSELVPAATDPNFNTVFHVDMSSSNPAHGSMPSPAALLTVQQPMKLVLTLLKVHSSNVAMGAAAVPEVGVSLVSTAHVEWRRVLNTGRHAVTIELPGLGATAGLTAMPVGVLDVRLDLVPATAPPSGAALGDDADKDAEDGASTAPPRPKGAIGVPVSVIQERIVAQQRRQDDSGRRFFAYAKSWWAEYTASGQNFRRRLVKVFADTEHGAQKPVTAFVTPLVADRVLTSPRHAARFVSLLPMVTADAIGMASATQRDRWLDLRTALALKRCGTADHATLLASLLLGFGLDAYVAYGSRVDTSGVETEYAWVATLQAPLSSQSGAYSAASGLPSAATAGSAGGLSVKVAGLTKATFWDAVTGERLASNASAASGHRFWRVGCLFNHESFYGNIQPDDTVPELHWDVHDPELWKPMDPSRLASVPRHSLPTVLSPPTLDTRALEEGLERQLLDALSVLRHDWTQEALPIDQHFSYILAPALAAYENERLTGTPFGSEDFQAVIKRYTPVGHTFKAFPAQFTHASPSKIVATLRSNPVAQDIISTLGADLAFALRVHVTAYAEDTTAVWVILGVRYRANDDEAASVQGVQGVRFTPSGTPAASREGTPYRASRLGV